MNQIVGNSHNVMCPNSKNFSTNFATEASALKCIWEQVTSNTPLLTCDQCPNVLLTGSQHLLEQFICHPDTPFVGYIELVPLCRQWGRTPLPFSKKEPLLLVCMKLKEISHWCYFDVLGILLMQGAPMTSITTAIINAMTFKSALDTGTFLNLCIQHGFEINVLTPYGTSLQLLLKSTSNKTAEEIKSLASILLNHKCDVNSTTIPGEYPVHLALQIQPSAKAIDVLDHLINNGADINVKSQGRTVLHVICEKIREIPSTHLLIIRKLSSLRDVSDSDGYKPIWTAVGAQNKLMVQELVKLGAKLDGFDRFGRTIAQHLVLKAPGHFCNVQVVKDLLRTVKDHNVDFNNQDMQKQSLVRNIFTVKQSSASISCRDHIGGARDSPSCFHDLIEYLLAIGVDLNSYDGNQTVLEELVEKIFLPYKFADILYALCKHSAKVEIITGRPLIPQTVWNAISRAYEKTEWSRTHPMDVYKHTCLTEIKRMKMFPVRDTKTLFRRSTAGIKIVDVSFFDFFTSNSLEMAVEIMNESTFQRRFTEKVLVKLFPIYGVLLFEKTQSINKIINERLRPL